MLTSPSFPYGCSPVSVVGCLAAAMFDERDSTPGRRLLPGVQQWDEAPSVDGRGLGGAGEFGEGRVEVDVLSGVLAYMAVDRSGLTAAAAAGDSAARRALTVTSRTSLLLSGAQLGITGTGLLVGYCGTFRPYVRAGYRRCELPGGIAVVRQARCGARCWSNDGARPRRVHLSGH